ncbi:MAG TPA: endonuclease/exonuclease/phosphatase family protein [Nocardioides sp.]
MAKPSKFVTKEAWGSTLGRQATPRTHPIGQTYGVTLHWEGPHMGSFPHSACDDKVRGIERYHEVNRGWADLAYNAVVCPHGYVFEGRGVNTQSAANGNSDDNDDWYALCYLGGEGDPFTDAAKIAFIEAVQWLRSDGNAGSRVNGHRDHKSTECPGGTIYRWLQSANFSADPTPPPPPPKPPVTTHTRWATRTTGVHATPGGKKLRDIPRGYKFQVVDGSGHGNDGWIQTSAGNWVLGADTTIWDPAAPVPFSVMTWNVENKGDADAALDRAEVIELVAAEKPTYFCLQEVYRVDLTDIPGYETYHPSEGYPVTSENRAQAILVRDDVALKIKQAIPMEEEWIGPKLGIRHEPRVHRYVTGNVRDLNIPVATFHVPFGAAAVEETRLAAIDWLEKMEAAHGCGVIVGDWNALAEILQAAVGNPAGATTDGGGKDRAAFVGLKKVKGTNLGNRGRSDHAVKRWDFEA